MSADSLILVGRAAAERLMTATCVVDRVSHTDVDGDGDVDDYDLDATDNYNEVLTPVYSGPCKIRFATNRVLSKDAEGQVLAAQEVLLDLPVASSGAILVDDRVTVTDGGPDETVVGRQFRIAGLFSQTYATAHRFPIESLS